MQILTVQRFLVVCSFLLAVASVATGQETINQASLSGRVVDPQGGVVPGAQVTARHTDTNITAEATTDGEGRYRFPILRVGPYEVAATLAGFNDAKRAVTLTVGSAFDLPLALTVGALDTTITVSAEATVIETARSQIAGTITQTEVRSLPMNGRQFLDLALLVPGVSPPNMSSTQVFAETSATPGVGISVSSQRNLSNSFIVDGLSANDDAAGVSGTPFGVDAIDQFQVVTSGGQAELGRALGGYVSVVTKSGTNTARGDIYGYFRDDSLNGRNALTGQKLPMTQKQYGASVGGPVKKNSSFYFFNVEHRLLDQSGLTTVSQPDIDTVTARLSAVNYQGGRPATGVFENPVHTLNLLGKLDQQIGARDQLTIRYTLYTVDSDNARGAGALNAPSASTGVNTTDHGIAVGNTMTLSSRMLNETRAQFVHSDLSALPTDPIGPAVSIAGIVSFGTASGGPHGRLNSMYQVVDNLSYLVGAHAFRTGFDVIYNDDEIVFPRSARGAYTFSSLANFLSGTYNNQGFTQTFGVTTIKQTNPNVGGYVQDEWKAADSLTINAGVRYDLQFLETINTDMNNVSPRFGFAWTPTKSRSTVVRGGTGLFYDRLPLRALANALLSANNTTDLAQLQQISVSLSPTQTGAPVFPNILPTFVPAVTLVNLTTMDRDIENAFSKQASLELEQQLGQRATVSVGYQYLSSEKLVMSINQNVPTCVASGNNNGCRPNTNYANNSQYTAAGESVYHGLNLSFVQRPTKWGNYRIGYTLSKADNNVGENFFSSPIDPFDLSKDYGRSDNDQRHRLVVNGSIMTSMEPATTMLEHLTHGFQISSMLQAYSSLPFNITSGVTTLQGTAGRPLVNGSFIPRNAGVGNDFFSMSLRVSRTFKLGGGAQIEGIVEAFNLTDRVNPVTRNGNFGAGTYPTNPSATFNQVTAVGEPRTFQFALRARF
jgi:hypothetical protein